MCVDMFEAFEYFVRPLFCIFYVKASFVPYIYVLCFYGLFHILL